MMSIRQRSSAPRVVAILASALLGLLVVAPPASAASVSFGTPTATSGFGKGVDFVQPISGSSFSEADIVVTLPGDIGPSVFKLKSPGSPLKYSFDTSTGQIQPNTKVSAHFQVVFGDGTSQQGPEIKITYADDRFKWQTKAGTFVTLHWYQGDDAFAQQALTIGENGISKSAKFLGVTETAPIDFFVYPDQQPFYDALGPGTRDNVGGEANTVTRTLFALIAPTDLGYARTVVPHELTHVVFDDGTSNPYHSPPRWLNEGLAVYLSEGYGSSDKSLVSQAAKSKTLMPLQALTGQFPTTADRFYLAYAESVSAVDYMIRKFGQAPFQKLVKTYRTGASDDEAFTAAFGVDTAAVNKGWLADNGIASSPTFGPQAAPAGPVPSGWTTTGGSQTGPQASQPASGSSAGTSDQGSGGGSGGGSSETGLLIAAAMAIVGVLLLCVAGVTYSRGRDAQPRL
jgi:Peptidase MA superfamily